MNGAFYSLIANACVALLFSAAFAVVRLCYPQQRSAAWFSAAYLMGMLTPLSELGVRFTALPALFQATSYFSFLASMLALACGMAGMAGMPKPVRALIAIGGGGALCRAAIWGGPRNDLTYELIFQAPFIATALLTCWIAIVASRRTRSGMWLAMAIVIAVIAAYLGLKPFFAAAFGSGASAQAYITSPYALFSQTIGGILIVMEGLLILLMIVRLVLSSSIEASETDALTNVANRRGFERRAAGFVEIARHARQPLAAILLDLDHFKRVNDRFGHATGDAVLRAFAAALIDVAPPSALVARLGGEEFVILLERTTLRGAAFTAQAVRSAVAALGPHLPPVTVSGGIAELKPGDTLETMLHRADARAYEAKARGRNRIEPLGGSELYRSDAMPFAGMHS